MDDGIFLHKVDSVIRHFDGERGWVGVFCPSRVHKKRPAPNFQTVKTDFPTGFNFTKVKEEEKLFEIENNGLLYDVIINNSPYEYGHSLIVPEPEKLMPQILTVESVITAIEIMFQSNQVGLRLMFNSGTFLIFFIFYKITCSNFWSHTDGELKCFRVQMNRLFT